MDNNTTKVDKKEAPVKKTQVVPAEPNNKPIRKNARGGNSDKTTTRKYR